MFIEKETFKDCKTIDAFLNIESLKDKMFCLEWDSYVLNTSLYQQDDDVINSVCVFSWHIQELSFCAEYTWLLTIHNFRAESLHLISMFLTCHFSQVFYQINIQLDKLYSSTQRRQHNAHISEDTYSDLYASWNLKTDS